MKDETHYQLRFNGAPLNDWDQLQNVPNLGDRPVFEMTPCTHSFAFVLSRSPCQSLSLCLISSCLFLDLRYLAQCRTMNALQRST